MHPYVAAGALCAILVLAGAAVSAVGTQHDEHDTPIEHAAASSPAHKGGHGSGAHEWSGGTGEIPTSLVGLDNLRSISIGGDREFNPSNGVRSGSGTFDDPYVISGWSVDTIYIHDTTAAFEIKENRVMNILVLDWTGAGGYVHHNWIANLRTNRNVERVGDPSAAVIEHNQIDRVEELRHFDGIVRNNTIGKEPLLGLIDLNGDVVLNIAGLNGAGIHHNLIYGGVDMKIHGHHHSDATGAHSHNHGKPDAAQQEGHVEDHQRRYVDFLFHNNTIKDTSFGMRYNDLNHAGDDRTATSEEEPDLEKPHVHHTRVALVDNVIDGATLTVAIMNSGDERHLPGQTGELVVASNRLLRSGAREGIVVQDVADARVLLLDNKVEHTKELHPFLGTSGILLQRFRNSTVHVEGNDLDGYQHGIAARHFDENTTWSAPGNSAPGAQSVVHWDGTVANPPEGQAAAAHDDAHGHSHGEGTTDARPALLPEGRFQAPL